jgi:hypothetical protein
MEKFDNIEDFKKTLLMLYKQEEALKRGISYWDTTTSNMDGTFFGEQFDNAIRIAITKKENAEFMQEIDEEALIEQARQEFLEDLNKTNKK